MAKYSITPARLNALSPSAQALARAAIEVGVWQLVTDKGGPAGGVRGTAGQAHDAPTTSRGGEELV